MENNEEYISYERKPRKSLRKNLNHSILYQCYPIDIPKEMIKYIETFFKNSKYPNHNSTYKEIEYACYIFFFEILNKMKNETVPINRIGKFYVKNTRAIKELQSGIKKIEYRKTAHVNMAQYLKYLRKKDGTIQSNKNTDTDLREIYEQYFNLNF